MEKNCQFSKSRAQRYTRVADGHHKLLAAIENPDELSLITTPRGSDELPPAQERVQRKMRADFGRTPFDGAPLKPVVLDTRMQSRWMSTD